MLTSPNENTLATNTILKRGFKSKAEKLAIEYREKLGVQVWSPICAFKLAKFLNVAVYNATEFFTNLSEVQTLCGEQGQVSEWSALTMLTEKGNKIIIHNPYHTPARQQSNVMHELAHVICEHKRSYDSYNFAIPFGMRIFDKEQEEEANCLSATLQIAKPGLFWAKKRSLSSEQIAQHFNASVEMVKYRMLISGVSKMR